MARVPVSTVYGLALVAVGLITALAIVAPVAADPKPGHGNPHSSGENKHGPKNNGFNEKNDNTGALTLNDGPPSGPGNSGVAHWCTLFWNDPDIENEVGRTFKNHGDCVSSFVSQRNNEKQVELVESAANFNGNGNGNGNGNDNSDLGRNGDLQILTVRLGLDGTFRLRGAGAEDSIDVTELKGNGVSIDVKDKQLDTEGDWVVTGTWDCSDHSGTRAGRFEASDSDETDRLSVDFPCGSL